MMKSGLFQGEGMETETTETASAEENAIRERLVEKVLARSNGSKLDDIVDSKDKNIEKDV